MLAQLAALPESLGTPTRLLADTGYFSGKNVAACEEAGGEPLIAVAHDEHHACWRERFTESAPLPESATPAERMAHRPKTKAGRAAYALRKQTRCSASSNPSWGSVSFSCADWKRSAANSA